MPSEPFHLIHDKDNTYHFSIGLCLYCFVKRNAVLVKAFNIIVNSYNLFQVFLPFISATKDL